MVGAITEINWSVADARKESHSIVVGTVLEGRYSVETASLIITDLICFIISKYQYPIYFIHDILANIISKVVEWQILWTCYAQIFGLPHSTWPSLIGEPCLLKYPASGDSFVVIDTSGVHEVGLDYCGCRAGGNEASQLLRFRLYPATAHSPNTATTFRCLHHFQLLSFESKCSVYEYFQTLVRESDNTGLKNVKVCSSLILGSLLYDIYLLETV